MGTLELVISDTLEGTGIEPVKGALILAHYEGFLEELIHRYYAKGQFLN